MNKKINYSSFSNLKYILSAARKWQPVVPVCLGLKSIAAGLLPFVWLIGAKLVLSQLENRGTNTTFNRILVTIVITALIELLFLILDRVSYRQLEAGLTDVRCKLMLLANKKMMVMPYEMTENPQVLDLQQKARPATADNEKGAAGMVKLYGEAFALSLAIGVSTVILMRLSALLAAIMTALCMLKFFISDYMGKWEKKYIDTDIPKYLRETDYYRERALDVAYAKDIRIYGLQTPILQKYQSVADGIAARYFTLRSKWQDATFLMNVVELLQEGLMYACVIYSMLRFGMSTGDFLLYVGSIRQFNEALGRLVKKAADIRRENHMLCYYREFLELPENNAVKPDRRNFKTDYKNIMEREAAAGANSSDAQNSRYEFRFEEVSFRYPGRTEFALKNINITLHSGEKLAVVGLNGAGKTTFVKLLCRLYEPTSGIITLNGEDIRNIDIDTYRSMIAPMFQSVECFAFPVAQNVSLQTEEETDKQRVWNCLQNAGLGEKIDSLEKGMDTQMLKYLYEDGIELSGGQRQKLGFARALYRNAPVFILDEPTAALDALAEYQSYMDFDRLIGKKTTVYISHRLSSTRFCDQIALFQNGCIVEYGTHETLLKQGGEYAHLFEVQAQYYQDGGKEYE